MKFQTSWLKSGERWGIGVSGGSDSLALLHLLVQKHGSELLTVILVDHGWSRTFAARAHKLVAAACQKLGVKLVTESTGTGKPATNAEAAARKARYAAFARACKAHKLHGVILGHTRTDQAEQFLMRAGRGSGLTGLTGIPASGEVNGVRVARPLLGIGRDELRAYLKRKKQPWLEDPANIASARGKIRNKLKGNWLDETAVSASIAALSRAEEALALQTSRLLASVTLTATGWALERDWLLTLPEELALRLLGHLTRAEADDFAPRTSKRVNLLARIAATPTGAATLGGCKLTWAKGALRGQKL